MEITIDGHKITHILTEQDDMINLVCDNLQIVIKHNDVGVSVDYYKIDQKEETPFREDQVWFED